MAALTPWAWMDLGALLMILWLLVWETLVHRTSSPTRPPGAALQRRRLETTTAQGDELRKLREALAEARQETR